MRIDLHIHTKNSDGELDIQKAIPSLFSSYALVAFTDHENIFNPNDFPANNSTTYISGVEICCRHEGYNIEVLGYDFDVTNDAIVALVNKIRKLRISIINNIFERNGFFAEDSLVNPFRINIPLPNSVERRTFWKQYEAEYISMCHSIPAIDVIETIIAANGVPVLAHPMESLVGTEENDVEKFILSLGLNTVELITPKHSVKDITLIRNIIKKNDLSGSIGSDSHQAELTKIPHGYDINERCFKWIYELIKTP